ncbi:MAG: hypothetical protein EOR84_22585 [Mesorhizobium sp.]|uniref:hypothetical protein n=1 Tax=Mesorhizobium sp. TaxID=1871066 RepID=UPI000FE78431|nr:hypothetical protein [Mesorhizobium sp.]RWM89999.1 MAG: hypothetical protein EOR84_22585 [Mesorhizobium sp.]
MTPEEKKRAYDKAWRERNTDKMRSYRRAWRERNREKARASAAAHYRDNKVEILEKRNTYYEINRTSILLRIANKQRSKSLKDRFLDGIKDLIRQDSRRRTNPNYRIAGRLRGRLNKALQGRLKGGSAVSDLGCSIPEFKSYIERQFQPGMSWDNWGPDTWHLDHIKPLASFDLTDREQFLQACHYTNYQPLWAADNMKKGARLT